MRESRSSLETRAEGVDIGVETLHLAFQSEGGDESPSSLEMRAEGVGVSVETLCLVFQARVGVLVGMNTHPRSKREPKGLALARKPSVSHFERGWA